ncbi:radical SAM protein [Parerythrobacter aestuarii]|uniref:radical SAM protein n=1 Tax=Parerythrobacter aestuarii TaxID=3020909 RepID=UPI0024DEE9B2|nr:radical SAM protein [Parerythrobacter aestuarii]
MHKKTERDKVWDRFPISQRLAINLLLKCNLSCWHCNVAANPSRTERLDTAAVLKALRDGWAVGKRHVIFSGGEPFLDSNRLSELVTAAHDLGYAVDIETNAYWARSIEQAEDRLRPLKQDGLAALVLSADAFHTREMPLRKTINAAKAARNLGLLVEVNFCPCGEQEIDDDILTALEVAGIDPIINPLLDVGRASDQQLVGEQSFALSELPDCDALMMTLHADGEIYSCCEINAAKEALSPAPIRYTAKDASEIDIGSAHQQASLLREFYDESSPTYFRRLVASEDVFAGLEKARFTSICDFCHKCFEDERRLEYLQSRTHV